MPKTYKRKRSRSKKRVMKRRRRPRIPTAFPKQFTTRLKYVEVVELDATNNGAPVQYNFRANSIYDPNITGIGHQPMGRDQFTALYDHYTVIGSRLKATFYPKGDYTPNATMFVGGVVSDTTNVFTSVSELLEQTDSAGKILTKVAPASQTIKTINFSAAKMFRLGKGNVVGNPRICAQSGSNPDEDATFCLIAVQPDGSSVDPYPIKALVEIEYLVVFSEKRALGQS